MSDKLSFSVRADLFRVAQAFTDASSGLFAGVRIEPLPEGGVVMVGWDGADMIALRDASGEIARPACVYVGKALTNIAVDLFRRDGVEVRIKGGGGIAFIQPDAGGQAVRDFERDVIYPDWRGRLEQNAFVRLEPPFLFNARMFKRVSDAAIGLEKASSYPQGELFRLHGGVGAMIATFPAWPNAVAMFSHREMPEGIDHDPSTLWRPPSWLTARPRLALVSP